MFATANRHEASKFNNLFICHVDLMPVAAAFQRTLIGGRLLCTSSGYL